ncbi:MAG TPA: DUF2061 domain-containing protein [Noviherbaspirillum sp.]|nr:DUF2061 domain-containing protein [Noviherbaspirillum sp.]
MIVAARTASQVLVHMSVAFLIMYAFTGSLAFGGLAAVLEPICVVGILPLHDRLWKSIEARAVKKTAALPEAAHAAQ